MYSFSYLEPVCFSMSSSNCCLANNNIYSSGILLGVSKEMSPGSLESLCWCWLPCGTLTGSRFFMPKRLLRSHTSVTSQHEGPSAQLRSAASGRSWGASYSSATVVLLSCRSEETGLLPHLSSRPWNFFPSFTPWIKHSVYAVLSSPGEPERQSSCPSWSLQSHKRGRHKWVHR